LTAGDVAKATGLARSTVSTTPSKVSKTGEVVKADRGHRQRRDRKRWPTADHAADGRRVNMLTTGPAHYQELTAVRLTFLRETR